MGFEWQGQGQGNRRQGQVGDAQTNLRPGPPADPDSFLKSARLQRLPSSSSEMGSQDGSPLRETRKDPFSAAAAECSCRQDGLTVIVTACLTFATGVTVALVMQIYFGDPQVRGHLGREGTREETVRKCLRELLELGNDLVVERGGK